MIQKLEIDGVHADVSNDLHKYVIKKIGRLDRYMARSIRPAVHAEIKLKEGKAKDKKQHTCEVILHLPKDTLAAKESTMNIYAAVDIVEAKIRNQLKKYKETHTASRMRHKLMRKFRRQQIGG